MYKSSADLPLTSDKQTLILHANDEKYEKAYLSALYHETNMREKLE